MYGSLTPEGFDAVGQHADLAMKVPDRTRQVDRRDFQTLAGVEDLMDRTPRFAFRVDQQTAGKVEGGGVGE